jgi:hypothetical protein
MLPKLNRWIFVVLAILFVATLVLRPAPASAAQTVTPPTNSCLTCHEDLYYLHDMGKWYCITEHKDRCVNCHEGDATAMNKDESHQGLIIHPQQNNGDKCQQCHPQDSAARLAKFASLGGYKTVQETEPYVPPSTEATAFPESPSINQFAENWPWVVGGCLAFGLWLLLVLFSPLKP